jgi:CRP/FNR family nitrogen fixation transcriptional regulator
MRADLQDFRRWPATIGGFYFAGDVFGLDLGETHQFSAEAIDNCVVLVVKRNARWPSATEA